jgi:hypothetical protein
MQKNMFFLGINAKCEVLGSLDVKFPLVSRYLWIGSVGKTFRKPKVFPLNIGFSCEFTKPIH